MPTPPRLRTTLCMLGALCAGCVSPMEDRAPRADASGLSRPRATTRATAEPATQTKAPAAPPPSSAPTPPPAPAPPLPTGAEARAVRVLDGRTGDAVPWDAMVSAAAGADAVIIGENHRHPLGLAFAAALWEDVLARSAHAALSMEFFERDDQAGLDDYLAGLTDEKTFRTRTRRTDGNYPAGHRAMVEAAKAAGRPVYAANAPRVYVRLARTASFERLAELTPEQRRLFRVPDELPASDSRYRRDFDEIMDKPHVPPATPNSPGAEPKPETPEEKADRIERGFRSQSLWDWTMAEAVADALTDGHAPVVHVVGRFHSDFKGGLVAALEKLRPGTRIVTVTTIDEPPGTLRDADRARADFVVYVGAPAGAGTDPNGSGG
ncbi:MAG: ChaN family lipoprotein [Phycisphaerales bacterium]